MAAMRAAGGGMPTQQQALEQESKKKEEQDMRAGLLEKMVAPDARERLERIKIVKPDKVTTWIS